MSIRKTWVFRGLVVAAVILMAVSYFGGWWWRGIIDPAGPAEGVWIYPNAFVFDLEGMSLQYIADVDIPGFIDWVPWVYVALAGLAIAYSLWKIRNKASRWLIGLVGLSYVAYAAFFIFYANMRMGEYDIPLLGKAQVIGNPINVYVTGVISWEYYLACAVGFIFIAISLFYNRILEKL